jgi:hypothetical protein
MTSYVTRSGAIDRSEGRQHAGGVGPPTLFDGYSPDNPGERANFCRAVTEGSRYVCSIGRTSAAPFRQTHVSGARITPTTQN